MAGLLCARCCAHCSTCIVSILETSEVGTVTVLILQMRNLKCGLLKGLAQGHTQSVKWKSWGSNHVYLTLKLGNPFSAFNLCSVDPYAHTGLLALSSAANSEGPDGPSIPTCFPQRFSDAFEPDAIVCVTTLEGVVPVSSPPPLQPQSLVLAAPIAGVGCRGQHNG